MSRSARTPSGEGSRSPSTASRWSKDGEVHRFRTEEELYRFLGYAWIPPELRENGGELAAARDGELPALVDVSDLKGELHCHSTWSSDGRSSIDEMARAAKASGYRYLALTDHSHYLRDGRMEAQWREIDEVNERVKPFRVLKGVEANIRSDGTIDIADETLAELDWVVASLHTAFDRSPTERILAAIDNPHVDSIGHLTGRKLNKPSGRRRRRGARRRAGGARPAPRSRSTASPTASTCATCMRGSRAKPASSSRSPPMRTRPPRSATGSSGSPRPAVRG